MYSVKVTGRIRPLRDTPCDLAIDEMIASSSGLEIFSDEPCRSFGGAGIARNFFKRPITSSIVSMASVEGTLTRREIYHDYKHLCFSYLFFADLTPYFL